MARRIVHALTSTAIELRGTSDTLSKSQEASPFEEFRLDSKAVIEHLFNDHTYCSKDWCPVLKAQMKIRLSNMI